MLNLILSTLLGFSLVSMAGADTATLLFGPVSGTPGHSEQSVAYRIVTFLGYEPGDEAKVRAAIAKLGVE